MSLVIISALKYILSDVMATWALFWLLFHDISFSILLSSTYLSLNLKYIFYGQYIIFMNSICFRSANLCLLIWMFNSFTDHIITDKVRFTSAILLFVSICLIAASLFLHYCIILCWMDLLYCMVLISLLFIFCYLY